ncbi:MAG: AmmeMemoRadiSam system protein B [Bacteroidota bacterium]|nr:AmmeMemoRadiSam system protein B [Bacteroidota bacterium]
MFDSLTERIPPLRHDLELLPATQDGEEVVVLHDPAGYSDKSLSLHPESRLLLSLFDGSRSISDLQKEIKTETGVTIDPTPLLQIIQTLDSCHFLDNDRFAALREEMDTAYIAMDTREAAYAGQSYPEDAEALSDFLHELFEADGFSPEQGELLGVLAPHIDLKIGPQVYVPAFKQLQAADFDTVVILGTSHYSYEDLFLLTEKNFRTPLGSMETDREFVRKLHDNSGDVLTRRDVAHKQEHSIEFPVLYLQHAFRDRDIRIVPILCTAFDEFLVGGTRALADAKYNAFLSAFHQTVEELGRRVVFVLSVDWSHVGRKFGDDRDAADMLTEIHESDQRQLHMLEQCDYDGFYRELRESRNVSHIDGFACITTFFDLVNPARGRLFDYQQWHEEERASAVSFASMGFFADREGAAE